MVFNLVTQCGYCNGVQIVPNADFCELLHCPQCASDKVRLMDSFKDEVIKVIDGDTATLKLDNLHDFILFEETFLKAHPKVTILFEVLDLKDYQRFTLQYFEAWLNLNRNNLGLQSMESFIQSVNLDYDYFERVTEQRQAS